MLHKKSLIVITIIFMSLIGIWTVAANPLLDQKAVLSGKVISVTPAGTSVREGTILVQVNSITGPAPAVRATTDGIVKEVLVQPGDTIHTGEVVVRIEPAHK